MPGPYLVTRFMDVCRWIRCDKQATRDLWDERGQHVGGYCRAHGEKKLKLVTKVYEESKQLKVTRCRFQTDWRGCNREEGHSGAHHDEDSGIDWTGGMVYE